MELLLNDVRAEKPAGFMIPIPQYPLYSATISEYNSFPVKSCFKNKKFFLMIALNTGWILFGRGQ